MRAKSRHQRAKKREAFWLRLFVIFFVASMVLLAFRIGGAKAQQSSQSNFNIQLEVGGGGNFAPSYEGAKSYLLTPYPIVRLKYLKIGNMEIGGEKKGGFSLFPSFKVRSQRSALDGSKLEGLPTVPQSFELGLGIAYETDDFRIFAEARNGVIGHHGWNGEIGLDLISKPSPDWTLAIGPRASFADNRYFDAYFGVDVATAKVAAFNPDPGLKSFGLAASARYEFAPQLAWEASAEYARLTGDAANSPIVQSKDQFTVRTGLAYTFGIGF